MISISVITYKHVFYYVIYKNNFNQKLNHALYLFKGDMQESVGL